MIPVQRKQEYLEFDEQVRKKGARFLASCPRPSSKQFDAHSYWTSAKDELLVAYNRLCAYTSRELLYDATIDHFKPKSKYPTLAYEWSNFRLARHIINNRKGNSEDVIDPFKVHSGWFILRLSGCVIKAGPDLTEEVNRAVDATISILQLNHERLVEERQKILEDLAYGIIDLDHLDVHYPFLSMEVKRQNALESLGEIFARA